MKQIGGGGRKKKGKERKEEDFRGKGDERNDKKVRDSVNDGPMPVYMEDRRGKKENNVLTQNCFNSSAFYLEITWYSLLQL